MELATTSCKTQAVYNRGGEGNLYSSSSSVGLRYKALRMTPLVENGIAQLITQTTVSQSRGQLYLVGLQATLSLPQVLPLSRFV